ncbi:MAG: phospholipid carrier-dependent glycosyltransferase, partial [Acidimicrobiia bacterium]|nr:phospholipid carrier-dependent glycosyltransferase [Acidimicrobiia bacterium]
FVLGWRVTGRLRGAVIGAVIVIADGVSVVTGRLALLDGLVALWTTLALLLLVAIADQPLDVVAQRRRRLLLGVVLGLALATKWTAAVLVPVAVVTIVAVDQYLPPKVRWRRSAQSLLLVGALTAGVYAAAHVPWLVNYEASAAVDDSCRDGSCDVGLVGRVGDIVAYQGEVWDYHRTLDPQQPDAASAVRWFGQTHAVALFVKTCDAALVQHAGESDGVCQSSAVREVRVLSMGNPVVWVVGPVALLLAAVGGWRRRDGAVLVLVGAGVMLWLPWLIGGRPGFTFYAAPLVPVLGAVIAAVVEWLPARLARWWPVLLIVVGVVSVLLWPLWTGIAMSPETADRLLWFNGWR